MSFDTNQLKAGNYVGQNITTIKNYSSEIRNKFSIPRQTINNWIKEWNNPKVIYSLIENTPNTLFVMADEKFIGCQDLDNDLMAKCFVIFEGIEKDGKHRNKLVNRMVISKYSSNEITLGKFIICSGYLLIAFFNIFLTESDDILLLSPIYFILKL